MSGGLRRLIPAAVVVLALAVIGGVAALAKPAAPAGPASASAGKAVLARQVPISSAIRVCPPGTTGAQNRVALFSSSHGTGGQAVLTPLPQAGARIAAAHQVSASTPSTLSLLPVSSSAGGGKQQGWSVAASGAMAQGAEAEIAESSGLGSVRCGEPGSDMWFVGPGQQDGGGQIQLDLMNVDSLAATVNLSIITDAGAVQSGTTTGITVAPHQLVTQSLSAQANGASVVAIEVRTSVGRIAADVSESSAHGAASWVPRTAPPSTRLVIPGVPPSGTSASLFLVVPGSSNARVNVVAITSQGRYQPFGAQSIDLPGQSATDVQLSPLGGAAAALLITSNVPVTADVLVPGTGLGAFTAAVPPITEQAVIAGNTTSGFSASMVLSAPAAAVRLHLTESAQGAPGTGQLVTIPAGRTVVVSVKAPRAPGHEHAVPFTIVITPQPGSGPVYAARIETQGQNTPVSIMPAESALTTAALPPVRDSYTAVSP